MDERPNSCPSSVRWWACALLVVVWAAAYLTHLDARDLRQEEGRRTMPAREMLAQNDFLLPTLYGEAYLNKPPGFNWIVASFGALRGQVDELASRLPSVFAVLGCAFLLLALGHKTLPFRTRWLAALMFLATPIALDKGTLGEIDATIALFILASWVVWWNGQTDGPTPWKVWLGCGALMSVTVLLKGPGGPAQFYPAVAGYLLWKGRLRELFGVRHMVAVLLMALPTIAWVLSLMACYGFTVDFLVQRWAFELGFLRSDTATGMSQSLQGRGRLNFLWTAVTMVLPWLFAALVACRKKWSERLGLPKDERLFFVCALLCNVLLFSSHSRSSPRHMIAIVFPVCCLAAMVVVAIAERTREVGWSIRLGRLFHLSPWGPFFEAAVVCAVAARMYPKAIPAVVAIGLIGMCLPLLWNRFATVLQVQLPLVQLAVVMAVTMLLLRGMACSVFLPWKAETDPTRHARNGLDLYTEDPIYTTMHWKTSGAACINVLFYSSQHLKQIHAAEEVITHAPCVAVLTMEEAERLKTREEVVVVQRSVTSPYGNVPVMCCVEVKRPERLTTAER